VPKIHALQGINNRRQQSHNRSESVLKASENKNV